MDILKNKKHFKSILDLECFCIHRTNIFILTLIFNTFNERLNNHQTGLFHPESILTADTVKQLTGLSPYQQRKAKARLENYFKIITYNFVFTSGSEHQCRAFEINF